MAYIIRIESLGEAGVPVGPPQVHEADDEAQAIHIATQEIETGAGGQRGVATVTDAAGLLLFVYAGRAEAVRS